MRHTLNLVLRGMALIVSLIPLRVLYCFSDIALAILVIFPFLRYRRKIVRKNLISSFPDKSKKEINCIELKFYRFFIDMIFESIKMCSLSPSQIRRRMKFNNIDLVIKEFESGNSIVLYLGHVCNWEWISSLPLHLPDKYTCCQVYHKLENPLMDSFMLALRGRFGADSIPMEQVLRQLNSLKNHSRQFIVGMIADQVPLWRNIHYWTDFMNQRTPVFTGSERIARSLKLSVMYGEVTREKRGFYRCDFKLICDNPDELKEYEITERYFRMLENNIKGNPPYWLWTHNRWKRTWQEWIQKREKRGRIIKSRKASR